MTNEPLWLVRGQRLESTPVANLEPIETYVDYNGPLVFTVAALDGSTLLAWWVDEHPYPEDRGSRYLLVPFHPDLMANCLAGRLNCRTLLDQSPLYVVDVNRFTGELTAWQSSYEAISVNCLPDAGVTLASPREQA